MANPIKILEEVKKDVSIFFPGVCHHIDNAISYYKSACKRLSYYDVNTIMSVITCADSIKSILFDAMVSYMIDSNNPIERVLLVEKEIKRLIKIDNTSKIKGIVENPTYQDRFHYVFGKKQRV